MKALIFPAVPEDAVAAEQAGACWPCGGQLATSSAASLDLSGCMQDCYVVSGHSLNVDRDKFITILVLAA